MYTIKGYLYLFFLFTGFYLLLTVTTIAQSSNLVSRVEAAIGRYYLDPFRVNADDNGKVTIKGDVNTLYDRLNIFDIVSTVKGVKEIEDLVNVNTSSLPDNMIKADIENAVQYNSIILEPDKINVKVNSGLVILTGTVSYYKEKLMAETISSWQDGVISIDNEIEVLKPQQARSDENLKSILQEILNNKFPTIKDKVTFQVKDGDVTLNGETQTLWEKSNIRKDFLQILGVKSVTENLKVNYREEG
jgi:osmotically-inducible protein OsmY